MNGTIMITGASSGIGRSTTKALAGSGYLVLAGVRNEDDGARIQTLSPGRIVPLRLDVTNRENLAAAAEAVDRHAPNGLAALINNAGHNYNSAFEHADESLAAQLMEVNFFGLCNLTRQLIPALRRYATVNPRTTAKIVNVSSIGGLVGIPWEAYYHASKFAVVGVTECLRNELWDQRVRAVVVCPGGVVTDFMPKTRASIDEALAGLPLGAHPAYRRGLGALREKIALAARFGSPPEKVSHRIGCILAQANPRFRHLVGMDAKLIYSLSRALPSGVFHAVLRGQFGA